MNQGMLAARHVAAVLSPEFLAAPWPTFEWAHITSEDPLNASGKLIPLLVRDLDLTGQRRIELVAPFRAFVLVSVAVYDFVRSPTVRPNNSQSYKKIVLSSARQCKT